MLDELRDPPRTSGEEVARDRQAAQHQGPLPTSPVAKVRHGHGLFKAFLAAFLLAMALVGAMIAWAAYTTGSLAEGLAYLEGDYVYVDRSKLRIPGDGRSSETVTLRNLTNKPLRIVGYNATCSCVQITGLPLAIQPNKAGVVTVRAVSPTSSDVPVIFLTDEPRQASVRLDVTVVAADLPGVKPG